MKTQNKWIIIAIFSFIIVCVGCGIYGSITQNQQSTNSTNEIIENVITEETPTPTPEPTPESYEEEIVYATTLLNLRLTPEEDSEVLEELPTNTELVKIGLVDGKWAKVKWSETEIYYVNNDYISTEKVAIRQTIKDTTPYEPATSGSKAEYQAYAHEQVLARGWTEYDFECLVKLWDRESGWNPNSHNSSSGAHGIPQALPASKMASEGDDYYTNGYTQIRWGLNYIANRYATPAYAWEHFLSHYWY